MPAAVQRLRWGIAAGVGALVLAGGAAAALVATGTVGGKHKPITLADAAFWSTANSGVRGLATANQQAQTDLAQTPATGTGNQLYRDGATIASYADAATARLRTLARLSAAQIADRHVLQSFVAANRHYATTIEQYAQQKADFSEVQSAAAAAAAADTVAAGVLPPAAQLPPPSVFTVSAPTSPAQTQTTQTQTTPAQTTTPRQTKTTTSGQTTTTAPSAPAVSSAGPSGHLYRVTHSVIIRDGPSTNAKQLGLIPTGSMVGVQCKTIGEVISGPYGNDPNWDYVTYNATAGYVTDQWIDTKQDESDPAMIPPC
jgi:hypothetical protein